jgi:hypothetical protein
VARDVLVPYKGQFLMLSVPADGVSETVDFETDFFLQRYISTEAAASISLLVSQSTFHVLHFLRGFETIAI